MTTNASPRFAHLFAKSKEDNRVSYILGNVPKELKGKIRVSWRPLEGIDRRGNRILNERAVAEIRALREVRELSHLYGVSRYIKRVAKPSASEVAVAYGVCEGTINSIWYGYTWRHVDVSPA